jgi:surface protein
MNGMFTNCKVLTTIPELDMSKVTTTYEMFMDSGITTVPRLNTSSVEQMGYMFKGCSKLTDILEIDTSNVQIMQNMFYGCSKLTTIPQMNASNATSMQNMFYNCTSLTSVPELNSSKVTNMSGMFNGCSKLETVSGLDMLKATSTSNVSNMFNKCATLTNLTLKNIKVALTIGSGNAYGHLLTVDSLVNTIKELWDYSGTTARKLTMGATNTAKLADIYVKLITPTEEQIANDPNINSKLPCEVCASTDEGAMLITDYVALKNWLLA